MDIKPLQSWRGGACVCARYCHKKEISEDEASDKISCMISVPDDDDYDDDDMDFVNENTGYAAADDYVPATADVTLKRNKVVNINSHHAAAGSACEA